MSEIPEQLAYSSEHEWISADDPATVGITAFAVEELGEIVFVELPEVGKQVAAGDVVGEIESTKAVSELYVPVGGEIVEINDALDASPEIVGDDPYGDGWLFKIRLDEGEYTLMNAADYRTLIES